MIQYLGHLSLVLGLLTALLVGLAGVWQDLSLPSVLLRSMVAGGLVFGFFRVGGEALARALLRSLAEFELTQAEKARKEDEERRRLAEEEDEERHRENLERLRRMSGQKKGAASEEDDSEERQAA